MRGQEQGQGAAWTQAGVSQERRRGGGGAGGDIRGRVQGGVAGELGKAQGRQLTSHAPHLSHLGEALLAGAAGEAAGKERRPGGRQASVKPKVKRSGDTDTVGCALSCTNLIRVRVH